MCDVELAGGTRAVRIALIDLLYPLIIERTASAYTNTTHTRSYRLNRHCETPDDRQIGAIRHSKGLDLKL
jgi:hypothetical protein